MKSVLELMYLGQTYIETRPKDFYLDAGRIQIAEFISLFSFSIILWYILFANTLI